MPYVGYAKNRVALLIVYQQSSIWHNLNFRKACFGIRNNFESRINLPNLFASYAPHTSILIAFGKIESHALFVTSQRYHKAIGCQGQAIAKLQKVIRNV
jgi:hypothetical protein